MALHIFLISTASLLQQKELSPEVSHEIRYGEIDFSPHSGDNWWREAKMAR